MDYIGLVEIGVKKHMKSKAYLRKSYKEFGDFIAVAVSNELEHFVLSASFTSYFNRQMKALTDEIEKRSNLTGLTSIGIIFNTNDEVMIIDAHIIGQFIADKCEILLNEYYKTNSLNKIVSSIVNGTDKAKRSFIIIIHDALTETLKEIYKEIRYKKEVALYYGQKSAIDIISLLILEDVCIYLGICDEYIKELID